VPSYVRIAGINLFHKLIMNQENTYLTKEKFDALSAELDNLKTVRRKEIAQDLEYAKSLGDLSENAEYHEAREAQSSIEERINKIESILKTALIVSSHTTEAVTIGSKVVIKKEGAKEPIEYTIVSSEEADITAGKLSYVSPLGETLMGKKKNQPFTFKSPKGNVTYTIVSIA
jgi:transcription elongation factor GreA